MNKPFPMCSQHRFDCFACERGRCIALGDTKFKGNCPFYKPAKAAKVETPEVAVKLASAFNEINVGGTKYGFFK